MCMRFRHGGVCHVQVRDGLLQLAVLHVCHDIERLIRTAGLIRKTHEEGDCFAVMSTRTVLNVARKLDELGDWRAAYELAFLNRLNRDDLATCEELIQKVWDRI